MERIARAVVGAAAAVLAAAAAVHIGLTALYLAPDNVLSDRYGDAIHEYMSPEFVQNWNLFAPEPPHVNTAVHARAEVPDAGGSTRRTGWTDLSAVDHERTRGNPLPSDTRDQLRKAWRRYVQTHDRREVALGENGLIAEALLRRIALTRLDPAAVRVQLRLVTTPVPDPPWRSAGQAAGPTHRELPWWPVTPADRP
ncbi:DUF5819 family protein [Amycolatopsis suaedae]|uniref:Uncharacterized protein n=1 Tax=Amycolatopsis suaedae TaxID=2510978 RepID=A0A4Q7JF52_9PSEU|nr:DUF5819 family protein [Amycolatopsis suaedae]RZQ65802.1 hypothetical protein EWH70_01585 [Amycolatopsis suaedae]